jgi:hypothetical protein
MNARDASLTYRLPAESTDGGGGIASTAKVVSLTARVACSKDPGLWLNLCQSSTFSRVSVSKKNKAKKLNGAGKPDHDCHLDTFPAPTRPSQWVPAASGNPLSG